MGTTELGQSVRRAPKGSLVEARSRMLEATGLLAQYCDKSEHNEIVDATIIASCAEELRCVGIDLLRVGNRSIAATLVDRLAAVEARSVLHSATAYNASEELNAKSTWRDLQLVQSAHDAWYHADVVGQRKDDQLRHYTLHLAKLCWMVDSAAQFDENGSFEALRAADVVIFGVKLATLAGVRLSEEPIEAFAELRPPQDQ